MTLAHLFLGREVLDSRLGDGAADSAPQAIDVAFVRELAPTLPPVAVAPVVPRRRAGVVVAEPAASSPRHERPPEPQPEKLPEKPPEKLPEPAVSSPALAGAEPPPDAASAPVMAQSADAASVPASMPAQAATTADATASSPVHFDWPPSTRMSYRLVGQYRGPLYGTARVDWLRSGERYQVRLEVEVPPVFTRRMLSDGVLGVTGLTPRRYDEETDVALRSTRRATVRFEPGRIVLANDKTVDAAPGVQDPASQFVQMTWLFLTRPELLHIGQGVEFPLALPRRVGRWAYDVTERVTLKLPFGDIETYHLQPRAGSRKDNELSVEMWIAPSLQYLPVRIGLRQDAETHLELTLEGRPLQADAAPAAPSP